MEIPVAKEIAVSLKEMHITQEEWAEALALAETWKEIRTDESYGPQGKNLGLLSRALLHLKGCYDTVRAAHED